MIGEPILGFTGEYSFLSNFHMVDIEIEGQTYKSSEHYYMCQKTTDARWYNMILEAPSGAKAKKIGRNAPLRKDWIEKYKLQSMGKAIEVKFAIPDMQDRLLATGGRHIEETNDWGDVFWGVCNGEGKNILGKILMAYRTHYRASRYE